MTHITPYGATKPVHELNYASDGKELRQQNSS